MTEKNSPLPLTKGFDFQVFAIHFGHNKIMFIPKDKDGTHYTLDFDVRPGLLDVHETWRDLNGQEHHRTVFAMRTADLEKLFSEIAQSSLRGIQSLLRKLRVGWLAHRKIGIVIGLLPTDDEIQQITKIGSRKRLRFDEKTFLANIRIPEYLEEIFNGPDRVFTLVARRQGQVKEVGFAFKTTLPNAKPRLFWVKRAEVLKVTNDLQMKVLAVATKFAIPPEEYSRYGL